MSREAGESHQPTGTNRQATFVEFNRLALTLAEQDLRQRIAKLKAPRPPVL